MNASIRNHGQTLTWIEFTTATITNISVGRQTKYYTHTMQVDLLDNTVQTYSSKREHAY